MVGICGKNMYAIDRPIMYKQHVCQLYISNVYANNVHAIGRPTIYTCNR